MSTQQTSEKLTGLALLRSPFPSHQISKLPKPTKKQTEEVNNNYQNGIRCDVCGGWHHKDVVHLDYVGHAALTDRLLDVDEKWTWEPSALDKDGLPAFDRWGGLWINLTICGVTRKGYGHADTAIEKFDGDCVKEAIGDALRNGAMRFGAALDLWHKGNLNLDGSDRDKKTNGNQQQQGQNQNKTADDPFEFVLQMGPNSKYTGKKIKEFDLAELSVAIEKSFQWYKDNQKQPHQNLINSQKALEKAIGLAMK